MKIYEDATRYDPVTGKPYKKKTFKEIRCDYTGQILDAFDDMYVQYHLDYEDRDPCFGASGEEYEFGQKHKISVHEFLSEPYHFYANGGGSDLKDAAEAVMMREAIGECNKKKSPWHNCYTFEAMCRAARILTATKLIDEGIITPDQLESP